ncbi:MAG: mechanosensitive ion channel family protein [Candidatus Omnitrophota bacterium]
MDSGLIQQILAKEVFGNTVEGYLVASIVFFSVLIGMRILKVVVFKRLQKLVRKTSTDLDDFIVGLLRHVDPMAYFFLGLYLATRSLILAKSIEQVLQIAFVLVVTYKAIQVLQEFCSFFLNRWAQATEKEDPTSAVVVRNINKVLRGVFWAAGIIFILDNLGINVSALVAGLGIGGIAVALAAQTVLGDTFSSFAILMDKPFKVGDFIIVGELMGTVEHIGFKTTRVRSLGGEQLIFSNTDLTNSRVRNYKRMETRRILFKIGVVYQTPVEKLKTIPRIVEAVIKEHELTQFDRAHFQSYGDFALIFEIVYYVLTPDYNKYMDVQHYINVRLKEQFEKEGIEFAYPTQQLYVTKVEPPS